MRKEFKETVLRFAKTRIAVTLLCVAFACVALAGIRWWCDGSRGSTPLVDAAGDGDIILVESLIGRGEDIDRPQKWYRRFTPIHVAVFHQRTNIVRLLIAEGADLSPGDVNGLSPLYWARSGHDSAIVKMLVDAGATLTVSDNEYGMYEEGYTTNTTAGSDIPANSVAE